MIRSTSRAVLAIALLAGFIGFGQVARASSYNFDQLVFTSPVLQLGTATDAVIASQTAGQYSFGGEFRQVGDTLSFTNVSIVCVTGQSGQCSAFDVSFEADNGIGPAGLLQVSLSLDGSLDSASGFGRVCVQQETSICPSNLLGSNSANLSFVGGIVGPSAPVAVNVGSMPFTLLGVFHLDALNQDNNGVQLPSSFAIKLQAPLGSIQTPEPVTGLLVGFGIIAFALLRRLRGAGNPACSRLLGGSSAG